MLGHPVQTVWRGFGVGQVDGAIIVARMCARGVLETLVSGMDYFDLDICELNSLLMSWKLYIYLVEVGDDDVKRAARVNFYAVFCDDGCMRLGHVLMGIYLYQPYRLCGN